MSPVYSGDGWPRNRGRVWVATAHTTNTVIDHPRSFSCAPGPDFYVCLRQFLAKIAKFQSIKIDICTWWCLLIFGCRCSITRRAPWQNGSFAVSACAGFSHRETGGNRSRVSPGVFPSVVVQADMACRMGKSRLHTSKTYNTPACNYIIWKLYYELSNNIVYQC